MAKVAGNKFVAVDEKYDKKMIKKDAKGMKKAGLAVAMKKAQKEEGYSKKPMVKPVKKVKKIVSGQKKIK